MYWTLELASKLEDAHGQPQKKSWIDLQSDLEPMEVIENLQELIEEEEGQVWENIEEIWPDYPTKEDFFLMKMSIK